MSSFQASRQTRPLFQPSPSSSLHGMETPLLKPTPCIGAQSSINLVARDVEEKPLPPTPRKASSVYSVQYDGMNSVRKQSSSDALPPPHKTLQPTAYRASTSRVLDATSKRPKLAQDAQAHAISDPVLEMRQLQQQGLVKTDMHWSQSPMQRLKSDYTAPSESSNKYLTVPHNGARGAEEYASNYESLLHTRSAALPTFTPEPFSNYDYLPSPMSPRITDVVDRSLLPSPLSYSTLEEKQRPPSTFSSSSSDLDGFPNGIRNSLRAYARKAFHLSRTSLEGNNHKKTSSTALSATRHRNSFAARLPRKNEGVAGPRRGSIQQGISNIHDTLAKWSITPPQPRSKVTSNISGGTKIRVPRELRSPAIPVTPYQQLGKKAWQSSRPSKKSQSPSSRSAGTGYFSDPPGERTTYFSNSPGDRNRTAQSNPSVATIPGSMVKKIASAFHAGTTQVENAMGLNKASPRLSKSERRREELKKKIVVVDLGDQTPGGLNRHSRI